MKTFAKLFTVLGFLSWILSGAFVSSGYDLIATVIDQGGDTKKPRWRLWANPLIIATLPATLFESLAAKIIGDYAALSKGKIISYSLNSLYNENTGPFIGAAGSEVEEVAILSVLIDTSGATGSGEIKYATMRVIAPADALFVGAPGTGPAWNLVDNTNADLITYLDNFTYSAIAPYGAVSDLEPITDPADPTNWNGKRGHTSSTRG